MCKAEMFNDKAASAKAKPDEIMKALDIRPGWNVADIGAGGGYFSIRFAEAVGTNGEVYAVDTNAEYLDFVQNSAGVKGLVNMKFAAAAEDNAPLPDHYFDLIFFRNVCHHIKDRVKYMGGLRPKLKEGGRIAIIEYLPAKGGFFSFHRISGHNVPVEKLISEMKEAGFKVFREFGFLPEQSFTVFSL